MSHLAVVERKSDTGIGMLTGNAQRVLRARYLKKDESGACIETPQDMFNRVARAMAEVELLYNDDHACRSEWEDRFYRLMTSGRFMPNSPTLMNAGREMGMLSACFVLPVKDTIHDIFDSIKFTALIQKAGGGTGFAFDELRPTGDYISSSGGTTSGPISFWRAFSEATNAIQQGAFRRGANMGMMYIHHPDILKFLYAKQDRTQFNNYNISIKVPDDWMESFRAEPDAPHVVRNPRTGKEYLLPKELEIETYGIRALVEVADIKPVESGKSPANGNGNGSTSPASSGVSVQLKSDGKTVTVYSRRDIWDIIINNAHATGEPGVVFMDRINEFNPTPHIGRMEATNPCGEQPLLPFEACNLGSINLALFAGRDEQGEPKVDWEGLRETIHESTRFLDNVIDANKYPLPQITRICKANRKIGLGVMGFADALYEMGVPYDSEEGVEWGERFMKFLNDESHNYGEKLAKERGSFPNWKGSIYDTVHHRPMRNATNTTVAPTGTISIIAGCSGGIEPMYSLVFIRNVLREQDTSDKPMIEINSIFERVAEQRGLTGEGYEQLMERIATDGTLAHIKDIPDDVRRVFVCAHDITPTWHMRMQAAFQKHCDASISKTINFPHSATAKDVADIYRMAYDLRCKGVTVYRDGCRKHQPMALKDGGTTAAKPEGESPTQGATSELRTLKPAELPEICSGIRIRQMTPFGNMHINVTVDPKTGADLEVFAQLGKGGDIANSDLEAICRMVSLWLRSGGGMKLVIGQLRGIGSSLQVSTKEGKIMSLGDGLARALNKYSQAKAQFGLEAMLLGKYNIEDVGKPLSDRSSLPNGHGRKNGNRNGNGNRQVSNGVNSSVLVANSGSTRLGALGSRIESEQARYKVVCPECSGSLEFAEGCAKCHGCGWSQC